MLLFNIFLVLILLMNSAKETSPDHNRMNAIDIYIIVCNIHVFFAIIEYAILLFFMKCFDLEWTPGAKWKKFSFSSGNGKMTKVKEASTSNDSITDTKEERNNCNENSTWLNVIRHIAILIFYHLDWMSLFLFPASFTMFNIYYWANY